MNFELILDKRALLDIQEAIDYYDSVNKKTAEKFEKELEEYINAIHSNPFYAVKYQNIRTLPLKKFPFSLHFPVDEVQKLIKIHAVLHTSRNPDIWQNRTK